MNTFKKSLVLAVISSSFIFILLACGKDDPVESPIVIGTNTRMSTDQESPIVTNSTASGTMNYSFDKTTKVLTYTLSWMNLADSLTVSHIHGTAARGVSAGVKVGFTLPRGFAGTYSSTAQVDGVLIKEDSLLNGFYYFNIHTKRNGGGEIRGQIEFK